MRLSVSLLGATAELNDDLTWTCSAHLVKVLLDSFSASFQPSPYFPGGVQVELVRAAVKRLGAVAQNLPEFETHPGVVY